MPTIDVRGLACPEPVLQVRRILENLEPEEVIEVLADSGTACENITRIAKTLGFTTEIQPAGEEYRMMIKKA